VKFGFKKLETLPYCIRCRSYLDIFNCLSVDHECDRWTKPRC